MPNMDSGHYFLTVLAPVRVDTMIDPIVGRSRSHVHVLAQKLALLPTGRQTAASPADAWPSPFANNTLNHFVRLAIISDPNFNGRVSGDSLLSALRRIDPLKPQAVDGLTTPYLLFSAELDAQAASGDGEAALAAYAAALWSTMRTDLGQIFGHCIGFEGVETAEAFLAYLQRCQVESTLTFNDYWADGMALPPTQLPLAPLQALGVAAAGVAVLWLVGFVANTLFAVFGVKGIFARGAAEVVAFAPLLELVLVALVALAAFGFYRWIMSRGAQPFPTAPNSDLPSILKGLFLQQAFTHFAIEAQGLDDEALQQRFGALLAAVRPGEPAPALTPGECRSPEEAWVW